MMSKTKNFISGLMTVGAIFAMVGTSNADSCTVSGRVLTVPTFDDNLADKSSAYAHIYVDAEVNDQLVRHYGLTFEAQFVNIANLAKLSRKGILMRSNNCDEVTLGDNGKLYRKMNQLEHIVLQ